MLALLRCRVKGALPASAGGASVGGEAGSEKAALTTGAAAPFSGVRKAAGAPACAAPGGAGRRLALATRPVVSLPSPNRSHYNPYS